MIIVNDIKKFKPVVTVGNIEYLVKEISRGNLYLEDGRRLPWDVFFKTEASFREFLKKFEKFKCDTQSNFMKEFLSLLIKYNVSLDIENNSEDLAVFVFDVNGTKTEVTANTPINPQRIHDIITLREKLNV